MASQQPHMRKNRDHDVSELKNRGNDLLQDTLDEFKERGEDVKTVVLEYVKERPFKALLGAVATGFVLSLLIRR